MASLSAGGGSGGDGAAAADHGSHNANPPALKLSKSKTRRLLRLCQSQADDALSKFKVAASSIGGDYTVADVVLAVRGAGRESLLHRACAHGASLSLISYLLDTGCDPNCRNEQMKTPLHEACTSGYAKVVALLVSRGALVDAHRTHSWTPLMYAVSRDHEDIARMLLDHGSPAEARNQDGMTALYLAAREGSEGCVRLLLERGGDRLPNIASNTKRTPLHVAIKYLRRSIVGALFGARSQGMSTEAGRSCCVDVSLVDSRSWGLWHEAAAVDAVDLIRDFLIDPLVPHSTLRDARGRTPLAIAALHGSLRVMSLFLQFCTGDVCNSSEREPNKLLSSFRDFLDSPDDDGNSPLALAASKGHADMCRLLLGTSLVDVNRPCAKGKRSILHLASGFGHEDVVRALLHAGADSEARDLPAGRTPRELAEVMGHSKVVSLF